MTDGIHGRACDSHVHCIFISVVMLRPSVWESFPKFSVLSVMSIFCSLQQSMDCESHACICVDGLSGSTENGSQKVPGTICSCFQSL